MAISERDLRSAAELKISINNSVHSCRQEKHQVIIKLFSITLYKTFFLHYDCLLGNFYRIAHSTNRSLIQLLKCHSKEI